MTDKRLRASGLQTQDQAAFKYNSYLEEVKDDVGYEDLFHPSFWAHHKKLKRYDIIRLVHPRDLFDVFVTVSKVIAGGVVVKFFGGRPPEGTDPYKVESEELAAAMKLRPVPIGADGKPSVFIEHNQRTKWRLIGLNSNEVRRDMTKDEAETALAQYLADVRMRMVSEEELQAELKLREAVQLAKEAPAKSDDKKKADTPAA